jgi:anhydro-N-acetylmuramic acid kinase
MDGVDAALIRADDGAHAPEVLGFATASYPEQVRVALRRCQREGRLEALARLNVIVGELFAEAALALLRDVQVAASEVACIGSHGQTLLHLPEPSAEFGPPVQATLQIGESAVIAARTGIVTVADFRPADLALGGQGAPLVPFLDWHLFRSEVRDRVLLNIGGVSNVTWLPAGCAIDNVVAFDTGPGNVLIDRVARARSLADGIDDRGAVAATGCVNAALLAALLADPYYDARPPKSADAAQFEMFLGRHDALSTADLLATVTEVTARTIAAAIVSLAGTPKQILIAGGGAHNDTLRARIAALLPDDELCDLDEVSRVSADAKEAVAFALLGLETLARRPGNVPSATGARGAAILGKVAYPPPRPG